MLNKSNLLFILILLGLGLVFASGWHLADEIFPGTFAPGNYNFAGSTVNFTDATVIGVGGSLQLSDSATVCNSGNDGVLILNKTTREILFCNGEEWEFFQSVGPFKNYWGDGSDGNISIRSDGIYQDLGSGYVQIYSTTQWPNVEDGDMVVINAQNFEVQSGVTFTTANRSRGLVIYATGDVNVTGTISMTARGAHANPNDAVTNTDTPIAPGDGNAVPDEGLVIRRHKLTWSDVVGSIITNAHASDITDFQGSHDSNDLFYGAGLDIVNSEDMQQPVKDGLVIKIPKVGSSGAAGISTGSYVHGGNAGTKLFALAGGGSGAPAQGTSGDGGDATCFSGGTGSGGAYSATSAAANDFGGAGSSGAGAGGAGGGAGNPGGGIGGHAADQPGYPGTGGLLIIFAKEDLILDSGSSLSSQGSNGGNGPNGCGGAASGGGVIALLYGGSLTNSGSISVAGGSGGTGYTAGSNEGGHGGTGSIIGPIKIEK